MIKSILLLAWLTTPVWAEVTSRKIDPAQTNSSIRCARGPHLALWDDGPPGNGLLLISLGGTGSRPIEMEAFDREAVALGYRALGIDYPNHVISTACLDSSQPNAFDRFRQEIVQGKAVSDLVKVDEVNSIESRIQYLLKTLASQPGQGWEAFFKDGQPDWHKIVLVGHSQGSGHAAYLGKLHPLRGVIMLGGPQDCGAAWLSQPGRTRPDHYYSFLHRNDFFNCARQIEAGRSLMNNPEAAISESGPIIVTTRDVADPHLSLIQPIFRQVWIDLLKGLAERT